VRTEVLLGDSLQTFKEFAELLPGKYQVEVSLVEPDSPGADARNSVTVTIE
jgi:hypothetical protein